MSVAEELIYDWNEANEWRSLKPRTPELDDETLRDGIQSPSVVDPNIEDKIAILHLQEKLGIHACDIGLPGAGPRALADVSRLAQEIEKERMSIQPNCACRTLVADIRPILEVSQKVGIPIDIYTFIGSSPIRQYVEAWDLDYLLRTIEEAICFAVKEGHEVAFVTEDTTRSHPGDLDRLFRHALNLGVGRLVLCDTVGHATPSGVRALVRWVKQLVKALNKDVKLDWHGHNDRGFAVANALAAFEAGVDRLHGTALGIGERVGNAAMDQLLVNLKLMGLIDNDLRTLLRYCRTVSRACHFEIPRNYPVVGEDAFRTGTGVHAAAIVKAQKKGDEVLADQVYSAVPARLLGLKQKIEIGPMSGMSNVRAWLSCRGLPCTDELGEAIIRRAKGGTSLLREEEVFEVMHAFFPEVAAPER